MCTAISYRPANHYFGRNLDLEYSYGESVMITPGKFVLHFRHEGMFSQHPAMIGTGIIADGYPLYFDGANEHGLCIAGLNFPGNAKYHKPVKGMQNVASFELIPWLLCRCENVRQVKTILANTNITDEPYSNAFPVSPLHWLVADKTGCITVESTEAGLHVYDNPVRVLTNSPSFDYQTFNLSNFMGITAAEPDNRFAKQLPMIPYSRGMGGIGLPGDLSSASRFVRAAFTLHNAAVYPEDAGNITQFFHILETVSQTDGCAAVGNAFEKTVYTGCYNADTGVYYYTTYGNRQISAVNLHREDRNGDKLIQYPLIQKQSIYEIN